jgi:glycosyltransferase involved in cell wall biosynthesis
MPGSFSVVVPCYNYGRFLRQCVESVLAQNVDLSVCIIDDESLDETPAVGRSLVGEDRRVTYRRHARNRGHIATYNEGLDWARGTYTVLLSADDMLAPGSLRRARDLLDARPDVVMVHGLAVPFGDAPPQVTLSTAAPEARIVSGAQFVADCCAVMSNPISTPTVVVRTSAQTAVGGYLPELPHAGDLEMWLRLGRHGRIAQMKNVQAFYRVHDSNMSKTFMCEPLDDERQLRAAFGAFFDRWGAGLPNGDLLKRRCAERLTERGMWSGYRALRQRRPSTALRCVRFAVSVWHDRPEADVRILKLRDIVPPVSYAVGQRRRRKRQARQAGSAPQAPVEGEPGGVFQPAHDR